MMQREHLRAEVARPVHLRTGDLDEARCLIGSNFYSHSVEWLQPSAQFDGSFSVARLGGVTVGDLQFGVDLRFNFGELGAYQVGVPLTGTLAWHQGSREPLLATPAQAAVFQPISESVLDQWSGDCRVLSVKIERLALESELERLLDAPIRGPLQLGPVLDLSRGPGRSWSRLVRMVAEEAQSMDGVFHREVIADRLHEVLVTGLLLAADHPYRDALARPAAPSRPAPVKRALDAMEAHPENAFTMAALSEIAGVGVRHLQEGFRQHVGMAPMAYLRRVRLTRVHEELCCQEPGEVTVTGVAHRWGFTHLSRFAAAYRGRYGVSPSTTLRTASRAARRPPR